MPNSVFKIFQQCGLRLIRRPNQTHTAPDEVKLGVAEELDNTKEGICIPVRDEQLGQGATTHLGFPIEHILNIGCIRKMRDNIAYIFVVVFGDGR